ncbi:hypothetical protein H632_c910p2 [Helicosporidium sp. ATCC 50920]|nr:hypothetical protein H632_c910p2 [Helicosporidium sp. ATCC 50920]|eukprot:KDD75039.1 hypothetical protein H632_c910p2 [Helicosporidium sp. ATCC 50920]
MVLPSPSELALHPEGPARSMLLRSRMMRSTHSVSLAERHAGLGLDAYVQVTSPIRRFADLLAHWQLKAALRAWGQGGGAVEQAGEEAGKEASPLALSSVPFSPSALEDLLVESAATTQRLVRVEREAEAYWAAAYFQAMRQRRGGRAAWRGTLLAWANQDLGLGRVVLENLGLEVVASVFFPAAPGEEVWLRCEAAEPREGLLKLVAAPWQDVAREEVVEERVVDEI